MENGIDPGKNTVLSDPLLRPCLPTARRRGRILYVTAVFFHNNRKELFTSRERQPTSGATTSAPSRLVTLNLYVTSISARSERYIEHQQHSPALTRINNMGTSQGQVTKSGSSSSTPGASSFPRFLHFPYEIQCNVWSSFCPEMDAEPFLLGFIFNVITGEIFEGDALARTLGRPSRLTTVRAQSSARHARYPRGEGRGPVQAGQGRCAPRRGL